MTSPQIEVVTEAIRCELGEGPHWCPKEQVLYFVDILKGKVLRYDPTKRECHYVTVYGQDPVGFVVPVKDHEGQQFMIGRGRDLCLLNWNTEQNPEDDCNDDHERPLHWVVVMAKVDRGQHGNRFNDGKCDPKGRLWAGTMGKEADRGDVVRHQGRMYFMKQRPDDDQVADVEVKFDRVDISNGLDWSLDGKTMYYIDSLTFQVDAFDYQEANGQIDNRRTVFDLKANGVQGFPDGMTIDTDGNLWVACFGGSQVVKIDPKSGQLLQTISFKGLADNITSVAFGGQDLKDLYVTSCMRTTEDGEVNGGQLFVVKNTGSQGLPGRSFDRKAQ